MDLNKKFATDIELEQKGAWVDLGDGARIKVARFGNKEFKDALKKASEPFKREIRNETMGDDKAESIMNRCIADHILIGWEGISLDDKELPYSKEKAFEILSNPRFRTFKERVIEESQEEENYRIREIEENEKN